MIYLKASAIEKIHNYIIDSLGGEPGVINFGTLDAASKRALTGFSSFEPYNDVLSKAAAIAWSIIVWHPFVDGNKRTAIAVLANTLGTNGISLAIPPYMVRETILIAKGKIDDNRFAEDIRPWCSRNRIAAACKQLRYGSIPTFSFRLAVGFGTVLGSHRQFWLMKKAYSILLDWFAANDLETLNETLRSWGNLAHEGYPRQAQFPVILTDELGDTLL